MDKEKEIEQQFEQYSQLSKENKGIDAAALMMSALATPEENRVPSRRKRLAYIISVGLPPFGLFFALGYYFFSHKSDAKRTAVICLILTAVSFLVSLLIGVLIFSSSYSGGVNSSEIQNLQLKDIQDLLQQ